MNFYFDYYFYFQLELYTQIKKRSVAKIALKPNVPDLITLKKAVFILSKQQEIYFTLIKI